VLAGFGFWLLSRGPVSLDAVAPLVAAAMSRGTGVVVAIDHTGAEPRRWRGCSSSSPRGVHLRREGGEGTLTLGDLTLEFSPRAALGGVIAPTRIIMNQPELRLDRSPDGSFHLGVGDLGTDAARIGGKSSSAI